MGPHAFYFIPSLTREDKKNQKDKNDGFKSVLHSNDLQRLAKVPYYS
jgi:hypothetical protein